jgi:hypothetical protein
MNIDDRSARLLRWYPPSWRARYGAELTALMEDTHGTNDVPFRQRCSIAWSGTVERARTAGLLGDSTGPNERVRAGSILVLCAWALFIVAGSIFAKFTDNMFGVTPAMHRGLPNASYTAVQWAGVVGVVLVLVAAGLVVPAFVRLLHQGGWASLRRPMLRALAVDAAAIALTVGLVVWAHQLSSHDRNGGLLAYGIAFVVWGLSVVAAVATSTAAAVAVGRRLDLSRRTLQVLGSLALALAVTMAVVIAGVIAWWSSVATTAPWVMRRGIGNGFPVASNTVPPTLVLVGVLMLIGLVVAAAGAIRLAPSLRSHPRNGAAGRP